MECTYDRSLISTDLTEAISGSLSNGDSDGDGNEDDRKVIGLDCQNNKFALASHFLVNFLTSLDGI